MNYSLDYIQSDNNKAVAYFGTTTNPNLAGYLLIDGSLLHFSYGQSSRVADHREIKNAINCGDGYSDGLNQFVDYGNIRITHFEQCESFCFQLSKKPTQHQKIILSNIINKSESCFIDIVDSDGYIKKSLQYSLTPAGRIFRDIDNYFAA